MSSSFHGKQTPTQGIHVPYSYSYANASARSSATGFTSDDLYKWAVQTDNKSFWILTSISPVTWVQIDSASASPLNQVLAAGNTTDGYNILVSDGDTIRFGVQPNLSTTIGLSNGDSIGFRDNGGGSDLNLISGTSDNDVAVGAADGVRYVKLGNIPVLASTPIGPDEERFALVYSDYDGFVTLREQIVSMQGDVLGDSNSNVVLGISGIPTNIAGGSPDVDGYVLTYVYADNSWEMMPTGVSTLTLAGDVTGLYSANSVVKINGSPVTTIGASNTILGTTDGSNLTYFQLADAQVSSSAAIAVSKLANASALSVLGRSANSSGAHADIAGSNNQALIISGSVLGFGALDLATMTTASADVSINSHKLTNVSTPSVSTDAATKGYVDGYGFSGLSIAGDVTGTLAASTVVKLQNRALSSSAPTDGYTITWDNGSSTWFTTGHFIDTGSPANFIRFGGSSATGGMIRVPHNNNVLLGLNSNGTTNATIINWGATTDSILFGSTTVAQIRTNVQSGGNFLMRVNSADEYSFDATNAQFNTNNILIDGYIQATASNPAQSGKFRIGNNPSGGGLVFRNAANNADVVGLTVDSSNVVVLGGAGTPNAVRVYANATSNFTVAIGGADNYLFASGSADFKLNSLVNTSNVIERKLGSNLTDASVTKNVSDGYCFDLPAGTLTASRTFTAGLTGIVAGQAMVIKRYDVTANTYVVKDNGGTTLVTMPAGQKYFAKIVVNAGATAWTILEHGGLA